MYGAAVCRLCYYRKPDALPEAGDIEGQAAFWKQHYNTPLGKGTVTKYVYEVQNFSKKCKAVKQHYTSWRLRHALGHKVEPIPKAYTRNFKHSEEDNLEFISLEPPDT